MASVYSSLLSILRHSLAILPGDLGLGASFLALIFAAIAIGTFVMLSLIVLSNRRSSDTGWREDRAWSKREGVYTVIFLIVVIVFATSTLGLLPYPYAHSNIKPTMTVDVQAFQWNFCISYAPSWGTNCQTAIQIPVGSTVLFNVTSLDVNHGFGIYSAKGTLLDQVQIMPGYYFSMLYQFKTSGIIYVRCMEFCGWGHFGMTSLLNITST